MKNTFDRKVKEEQFLVVDLVLKWDVPREEKGKHGKFDICGWVLMSLPHTEVRIISSYNIKMGLC